MMIMDEYIGFKKVIVIFTIREGSFMLAEGTLASSRWHAGPSSTSDMDLGLIHCKCYK